MTDSPDYSGTGQSSVCPADVQFRDRTEPFPCSCQPRSLCAVPTLPTFPTTTSSDAWPTGWAGGGTEAGTWPADPALVQQTKTEIRTLVRELAELAQADLSLDEFFTAFLDRLVAALAAAGGAIWIPSEGAATLQLSYQIRLHSVGLAANAAAAAQHAAMLTRVACHAQPVCIPPACGAADAAGNPTEWLLLVGPLVLDGQVQAVVEVFQQPRGGPVTQRGYLRFLSQMCDLATDYLKNRRLRQLRCQQQWHDATEQFLQTVHRDLDLQTTAYAIANEGRRVLGVDRVSVVVRRGAKCEILAVSGVDTIDRRAAEVAALARLATLVVTAAEPLWHPDADGAIAPQLDSALQGYVDQSQARLLGVIPLRLPNADETASGPHPPAAPPLGALVVEQFHDNRKTDELTQRVHALARFSVPALQHALVHESLFLLPLWRTLGQVRELFRASAPRRALLAAAGALTLLPALLWIPTELRIAAPGRLQAQVRRDIFAPLSGTVAEVAVEHGEMVQAGQVLLRLRNMDLELETTALVGRRSTTHQQLLAIQHTLLKQTTLPSEERDRLSSELTELKQTLDGLDRQLELLRRKESQLLIRSPRRGQIVTWQVRQELQQRPVQMGQKLLTLIDPDGGWELELCVPEHDVGHVITASRLATADERRDIPELRVAFQLHTHPGREFTARVSAVERTARTGDLGGSGVLVRAVLDPQDLPELRSHASVAARIACGRRALGYVLFRDAFETVQSQTLLWW